MTSIIKKAFDWIKKVNSFNLANILLPGYKFNNLIFKIGIGIIFIWLLIAGSIMGFSNWKDQYYIKCDEKSIFACENPYYNQPSCKDDILRNKEYILPGEVYGNPPNFFYNNAGFFSTVIMLLCLLINHLLYNKEYEFKVD